MNKPSPEAKALSLYLMAFKKTNPLYKEMAKRINRRWDLVMFDQLDKKDYYEEVQGMLTSLGGYSGVIEKTVRHYVETTGEWKLKGGDKYCVDAQKVADKLLKQK